MSSDGTGRERIVVGVDSSLGAHIALEHAARRLDAGGLLVIAHVVTAAPDAVAGALGGLERERRALADRLVERLVADVDVATETCVLDGGPAEAIAELARERDAAEIVVGSRGLGRFAAALGSVSHGLLGHADRPVVVVPKAAADHPRSPAARGACTVVVGYDGSDAARTALAYAARRAAGGGRVVAVNAFQPAPDWLGSPYYQRALDAHQEESRRLLAALPDVGADVSTSLLEGPAARAIIAAADARDADEIVIGSRGLGRVRGVLGSVSHALLHEADRPVVVIPAAAA